MIASLNGSSPFEGLDTNSMKRPWNNRLIYTFFLSYLSIIILLSLGFFLYSRILLRDFYRSTLAKVMEQKTWLLARQLPWSDEPGSLDSICRTLADELGVHITVIAQNGTVIGDSDQAASQMDNHSSRPEVIEALSRGTGSTVRYSSSVKQELLYRTYRQNGGARQRILRVAVPLTQVQDVTRSLGQTLLVGLLLCSFFGLGVAYLFSRRLSNRVNRLAEFSQAVAEGQFAQPILPRKGDDELNLLERNLCDMSLKIRDNINALRSEKEKLDSILRCMVEGLVVIDPKGKVLLINEQAKAMFGVSEEHIRDGSFVEISRSPAMRMILREMLEFDFSKSNYSKRISVEDGRWFTVNAVSLRNGAERPSGSILVFHDITEIQRLETVRSDFVANVSHELRTPLTAIRGYVETLLQHPPSNPADANQFLKIIDRHSERLSRLTEDLLVLSDLESGTGKMTFRAVEAGQLIQRVLEVFWDRATKRKVSLSYSFSSGLPSILGDSDRLQQLFINLVDNAVKFTPAGGSVTINAWERYGAQGDAMVEIAVVDTGAGIAEKDLPRLTVRVFLPAVATEKNPDGILFLCTGNSCRSQMAEGFARQLVRDSDCVYSAGTAPRGIHPLAIRVMREVGIDISGQHSKGVESIPLAKIRRIITLCGEADENCPPLAKTAEHVHWSFPDPALARGDEERILQAFRDVRDSIRSHIHNLLLIPTSSSTSASHLS